jgi:hyperosmotically inducible periplasmic protein
LREGTVYQEIVMNLKVLPALALAALIGGGVVHSPILHAQESATHSEMNQSDSDIKSAADAAGQSIEHAYRATADELGDAALTTKVKTALLQNPATDHYTIHVDSDQGKVTLHGSVDSPATAARAQSLAQNISGVSSVSNELTWPTSAR